MKKFENYCRNLEALSHANEQDLENPFIVSGIISQFSLQFELGWKTLKELLAYEGVAIAKSGSPRDIIKAAFQYYGSLDEDTWLSMLSQRNNMTHVYDANSARKLTQMIITHYIPAFQALKEELCARYDDVLESL